MKKLLLIPALAAGMAVCCTKSPAAVDLADLTAGTETAEPTEPADTLASVDTVAYGLYVYETDDLTVTVGAYYNGSNASIYVDGVEEWNDGHSGDGVKWWTADTWPEYSVYFSHSWPLHWDYTKDLGLSIYCTDSGHFTATVTENTTGADLPSEMDFENRGFISLDANADGVLDSRQTFPISPDPSQQILSN